ncbi:MAG: secretory lipase precursor [Bradyrhizobium sp.]|nr:secretory lipase precursor [Bradyrhizobium sp.]
MTKASEPSLLLVYAMYVPQSIASTDANVDLARILTPRTLANLLRLRQECVSQSLSKGYWASAIPKDQFVPSVDLSGVVTWTDANDPGVVRIAAPTLMMQGTADVTVQPRTTDVVADKLCASGNELTYRVVPAPITKPWCSKDGRSHRPG